MTTTNSQLLRQVSHRGKLSFFVYLFLPVFVLVSGIGWYIFQKEVDTNLKVLEYHEMTSATTIRELIEHSLESVSNDLLMLAEHSATTNSLIENRRQYQRELADKYLTFCKREEMFEQAFLIDNTGQEIVRIIKKNGEFSIVPPESLRDIGDNEYLRQTMTFNQNEVNYVSLYSSSEESVGLTNRHKVIRVSSPVQSSDDSNIGMVVLDFSATNIMEHYPVAVARDMDRAILVDKEGYLILGDWLDNTISPDHKGPKGPLFQDRFPYDWSKVQLSGQGHFRTDNGLFTFAVIGRTESDTDATLSEPPTQDIIPKSPRTSRFPEWTLISRVTPEYLAASSYRKARAVLIVSGSIALFLGAICWVLAGALTQHRRKQDIIRKISERVSALTGECFFHSLAEGLCEILNLEYAIVGEMVGPKMNRIQTLAFYANGKFAENIEYALAHTPCESVIPNEFCVYRSGIQKLFPKDHDLVSMEAESYIGITLSDSTGRPFGILAALGKKKITSDDFGRHELGIFAARASAELERKHSEKSLQRSEYILRESQKAARIGSYKCDLASGIWESSDILNDIAGIDAGYDRTISGWLNLIHPEYRDEMRKYYFQDVLAGHSTYDRQYRIIRQCDNAVRWVHAMGILEFDKNGQPIEMIGTIQDITEQKDAEDALLKSKNRYEELFTSLLEGVCMVDESETINFCNPAFSKLLEEESPEHVIGKSIIHYLAPGQQEDILLQTEIRRSNLCSRYEVEIITAKSNHRIFQISASPHFSDSGEYRGASANIVDMTEVKRLRDLESRAQRLETAGQVAGQIAHDFNNLLAPLMAYPELIRDELPDEHPANKYLGAMERSAAKIAAINDQLLTLGRRGHYNLVPTNLNHIIQQAVDESKQAHDSIEYNMNLSESISKFLCGAAQIHRVILNLLENACDAMMDSGVISITTENYSVVEQGSSSGVLIPTGDYVKLTVTDSGEGIDETLLPKIFDPFFSSKETDNNRGSGLGLSIVHSVVADHGGYLDLASQVGKGTSFYLYFPVTYEQSETPDICEYYGGSESVLIVDDDPLQREVSHKLLANLGYKITLADCGEMAIELLSKESFDILILDMAMSSGIDGTETYRRALEIYPGQKGIIVSGFSESARVTEAKSLGVGAFVKKPLTREIIARAIRAELDREIQLTV